MKNVTVRLNEEKVKTLDEEADDLDMSRAEYIRDLIEKGREAEATQIELERTQAKLEDLRRQLQAKNAREDDISTLAKTVEDQQELMRYHLERQRLLASAGPLQRLKWAVTGVPVDLDDE